jgi:putative glutamine amidotransferase
MTRMPWVGLPADRKIIGAHAYHVVGEKYLRALVDAACVWPVPMPSLDPALPLREWLASLDGLFLTGSYSNIEPHHYSGEPSWPGNLHDPQRDANTLGLLPMAIEMKVPVLAVCRGLQEVNVALGGSLHQKVHEVPGMNDHREDPEEELDEQYAPSHPIVLREGGLLHGLAGSTQVAVNSLHGQGIARIAHDLEVEARAPDGLIEAVRLKSDQPFLLAVQWHPEWKVLENPFYYAIFRAFGEACRVRAAVRRH